MSSSTESSMGRHGPPPPLAQNRGGNGGGAVGRGISDATAGNFLPNIDDLFVNHSLSEIKMIERKFHNDIDRKREDLRMLVGERYKDVIDVSDKLMGITQHSTQIKERLRNIESLCEKFQRQNHIGSGIEVKERFCEKKREAGQVSGEVVIGCQLKLLSVVPEKILIFLDRGQYVKAAQLVHLAQVIKDCLIGPLSENRHAIKSKFTIINRISVQQLQFTIKQSLATELYHLERYVKIDGNFKEKGESVSNNTSNPLNMGFSVFAEVVEAFCVLDGIPSLEACLHCMNVLSDHLKQFLEDDKSTQSVGEVLAQVNKSMLVLSNCVSLLISGHWGNKVDPKQSVFGIHSDTVASNDNSNKENCQVNLFDVLYPQQSQLKRCLPSKITEFKLPGVQLSPQDVEEFERAVINCLQQSFIDKLTPLVEEQLKYVKNVKSLTNIKAQLLEMVSEFDELRSAEMKKLESQLRAVSSFEFHPWKQLFEPLFLHSIKCIVKESALAQWNEVDSALTNHFMPLFDHESQPKSSSNKNGVSTSPGSTNETVVTNVNLDKATYLWNQSVSIDIAKSSTSSFNNKTDSSGDIASPPHSVQLMTQTKMRTETPVIISISQNLDDIVDCLCEKTKDYFSKKHVIKNTDSSYGILTEKSSSGAIFTNITIDGSKNQGNDDCGGAVSNINVEVSTILISKLIDFIESQNQHSFHGSLLKLEVQIRLLDYISSNCNCVRQLKKSQVSDLAVELLRRMRNLTDTLQKSWVEKLTEEATIELLPHAFASSAAMEDKLDEERRNDDCCYNSKEQLVSRFMAACWEQVDITEETEDGQPVTTKLSIPIKASHPIHQLMYFVTRALNRILPPISSEGDVKISAIGKSKLDPTKSLHGAPSGHLLCERLRESLLLKLSQYYELHLYPWVKGHEDLPKNSKLMIQFVYDIKFVSAILKAADSVSFTDSSIIMNESFAALSTSRLADVSNVLGLFEEFIDPFDYDVYSSHLSQKLMQELSQSQHLYGFLMGSSCIAKASAVSSLGSASSKGATHNLCDLVAAPAKFQPLSIPANASFGLKRNMGDAASVVNKTTSSVSSSLSAEKQQTNSSGSYLKSWLSNK